MGEVIATDGMPQSWDDFGMDWDDPNPLQICYWRALEAAFRERFCNVRFLYGPWQGMDIFTSGTPLSAKRIKDFQGKIFEHLGHYRFIDPEAEYSYDDPSFGFKPFDYAACVRAHPECDIALRDVHAGMPLETAKPFMKACKALASRLHLMRVPSAFAVRDDYGIRYQTWSSRNQSPTPRNYGEALQKALAEISLGYERLGKFLPASDAFFIKTADWSSIVDKNFVYVQTQRWTYTYDQKEEIVDTGTLTLYSAKESMVLDDENFDGCDISMMIRTEEKAWSDWQVEPGGIYYRWLREHHPQSEFTPGTVIVRNVSGYKLWTPIPLDTFTKDSVPPPQSATIDGLTEHSGYFCRKSVDIAADFSSKWKFP